MGHKRLAAPAFVIALLGVGCSAADHHGGSAGVRQGSGDVDRSLLTAGTWDDNLNFSAYENYISSSSSLTGAPAVDMREREEARDRYAQRQSKTRLDVALVIDTTGSMTDEIEYLRREFVSLTDKLEAEFPNAEQHWSLVAYGDEGDAYEVESTDFVDDTDAFLESLQEMGYTGGGDYPEASHLGLAELNALSWRRQESVARLAFWVTDAPHHADKESTLTQAIFAAQASDVHIYPIAASGVDELAEHTMRTAAQLTGGRYLFLTDDSGIGDAHKEPSIPCYFVTHLQAAIRRMVAIELSGEYREPAEAEIIRTGGDPSDGQCTLEDGGLVSAF